jgi:hypothetical protein
LQSLAVLDIEIMGFLISAIKCRGQVRHELFPVGKFKKDTENLIMREWPLGNTILSATAGVPNAPCEKELVTDFETFPDRLIGLHLRSSILELTKTSNPSMNDIEELIERAIRDKAIVKKVNHRLAVESGTLRQDERRSIRKMMSRC